MRIYKRRYDTTESVLSEIEFKYSQNDAINLLPQCSELSITLLMVEPLTPTLEYIKMRFGSCGKYLFLLWIFYRPEMEEIMLDKTEFILAAIVFSLKFKYFERKQHVYQAMPWV